ncbi:MAG: hypothetical protein BYD32DRAFT_421659 [Podila humilis]|nr:MAG: hypothetical protein BYD32DRAFT_421659 [Podila humilis]
MKFVTAIIAAAIAAVTSAQSTWDFPAESPCVAACTAAVGKSVFPLYDDVNSEGPFFLASLSFIYDTDISSSLYPIREVFRNGNDICMLGCPETEQEAYRESYFQKFVWYHNNKSSV